MGIAKHESYTNSHCLSTLYLDKSDGVYDWAYFRLRLNVDNLQSFLLALRGYEHGPLVKVHLNACIPTRRQISVLQNCLSVPVLSVSKQKRSQNRALATSNNILVCLSSSAESANIVLPHVGSSTFRRGACYHGEHDEHARIHIPWFHFESRSNG